MRKKVKADKLQLGMYVILSQSWIRHPFLKNEFKISSTDQIKKIQSFGINQVIVDEDRSSVQTVTPEVEVAHQEETVELIKDNSEELRIVEKIKDILSDNEIPPQRKAKVVYKSSVDLTYNLLRRPTQKNIKEYKEGIFDLVDHLLVNDELSNYLLDITSHDYSTYTHSVNVGVYSILLAKAFFKDSKRHNLQELAAGFFLHDIGKVNVDSKIINKPGRLTDAEMGVMKTHPSQGYRILWDANQLSEESKIIVLQHHERHDGSGYPRGLKGNEIHIYGKICSVADVYDALTSKRPYKDEVKPFEALKIMKEEMINHFQKDIFEEFVLLFN